jgi:hypothetical protein
MPQWAMNDQAIRAPTLNVQEIERQLGRIATARCGVGECARLGSPKVAQTDAQGALSDHITKMYKTAQRTRYAEEREWATAGYFDQNKQWLEEDPSAGGRLRPMDRKKDAKWPQPITNLFSKTINTNANALGAYSTAMGTNTQANADGSVAIGTDANGRRGQPRIDHGDH